MPKASDTPTTLRPYISHGVDLQHQHGSDEYVAECPFCAKKKFFVSVKTGLYQCKVCQTGNDKGGGNALVFIRELWKVSFEQTPAADYDELAKDRGLLYPETLISWEVAKSILTGEWMVPGYGPDGKLHQLYIYRGGVKGKSVLMNTAGLHDSGKAQGLYGVNLFDSSRQKVIVCEGSWNGMSLWECLRGLREGDDGQLVPSGEPSSLLKDASIIAVPGAGSWQDGWSKLLVGKDVVFIYDSDHPGHAGGKPTPPAGWTGMRRAVGRVLAESSPSSVSIVQWGSEGYAPDQKSGYDVRDHLKNGGDSIRARSEPLKQLLDLVTDLPKEWLDTAPKPSSNGKVEASLSVLPCDNWKKVRNSWIRAMKWTDGLDYSLAAGFAVIVSTDVPGDQLWIKMVSPPSTGKTTIVEGYAVAKNYTYSKDKLTGLYSGFQVDPDGKEDLSMINQLRGKTFIIKDGDTILNLPNMGDVLSQLRALYDRALRVQFKNKMSRDHENINCTVILCGTNKIRKLDESELGERFVDVVIMDGIDPDHEEDICDRVINRLCDEEDSEEDHEEKMAHAKRLTGGYVEYLRQNARALWKGVAVPPEAREAIRNMAIFVAHIRARPGAASASKHSETSGREMAPRLTGQLTRMAKCLAIVLNKDEVDRDVLKLVRRCALDTAHGVTLAMCSRMNEVGEEGTSVASIAQRGEVTEPRARELLRFLQKIKVAEPFDWLPPSVESGKLRGGTQRRWRMTKRMRKIYRDVTQGEDQD